MSDVESLEAPRSTGEIVSDAVFALRKHFKVVFSLAVPFCAVDLLVREVASSFLLQVTSKIDPMQPDPAALAGAFAPISAAIGFLIASFFVQSLLNGAVVAVGDDILWKRPPSVGRAVAALADRGAALILTSVVFVLLLCLAMGITVGVPMLGAAGVAIATDVMPLLFLGVAVGLLLSLVVLIVLTLRWSLYAPAVMVERLSLWRALSRSSSLTAARGLPFFETPKFRLSVLLFVALAISGVLQSLFVAPRLILAGLTGWTFANGSLPGLAQMPVWFMVPFGLLEIVTNATVIPLSGLLLTFFAFDLRARYEGIVPPQQP